MCELIRSVLKCVLLSKNVQNHSLQLRKSEDYDAVWNFAHSAYSVYLRFLFWVTKRLLHQLFYTKGNACPSCNILLTNENCQPHSFQLSLAHSASCQIFTLIFSGVFLVLWYILWFVYSVTISVTYFHWTCTCCFTSPLNSFSVRCTSLSSCRYCVFL